MNSDKASVYNTVKTIHASPLCGTIIECGSAAAITSKLMNVPGASATVYTASQPYSKEIQEELFGDEAIKFTRSVSKEFVAAVFESQRRSITTKRNNFVLVASVQMSDGIEDKLSHGWFLFYHTDMKHSKVMHFTLPRTTAFISREEILDIFGNLGVAIIDAYLQNKLEYILTPGDVAMVDAAYNFDHDFWKLDFDADYNFVLKSLEKADNEWFVCFRNNDFIRLEDIMRASDHFIIEKGSFNPMTHAHKGMIEAGLEFALEKEGDYGAKPLFMISTFRYDKPHVDVFDLMQRVKVINDHGFDVLICTSPLFYTNFDLLIYNTPKSKRFSFVVGTDTINRIAEVDSKKNDDLLDINDFIQKVKVIEEKYEDRFRFIVLKRKNYELNQALAIYNHKFVVYSENFEDDGISSTAIRNGIMKNLLDESYN